MRPCDCKDRTDIRTLQEQGLAFNGDSITAMPLLVEITIGACSLRIRKELFLRFCEWYLTDQQPKHNKQTCPKSDTWFADGGRCGWADECAECKEFKMKDVRNKIIDIAKRRKIKRVALREKVIAAICKSAEKLKW